MRNLFVVLALVSIVHLQYTMAGANDKPEKKKAAILIYDGVYLLDFAGPMEVFSDAWINDSLKAFEVFLVAPTSAQIACNTGAVIMPAYSIDNCPVPDILVIPGGNLRLIDDEPEVGKWIRKINQNTEITMSVCTGAFILADLNMLDGMEAATWHGAADRLQALAPKAIIKKGVKYTDNGKIITTAGVSAGIDGALHVVKKLFGEETAKRTANYIEYDYNEKP